MRPQAWRVLQRAELVTEQRQVTRRGDRDVLHAEAARGGVARVRGQAELRLTLTPVQFFERRQRHEDLAPHFDQGGNTLSLETLGHVLDGAKVFGDVFSGDAIAARRAPYEPSILVLQGDREPVHLRLGDEPDR